MHSSGTNQIFPSAQFAILYFATALLCCHALVAENFPAHEGSISLLQAVEITLSQETQIQLQKQEAEKKRGVAIEEKGAFDLRMVAIAGHGVIRSENPELQTGNTQSASSIGSTAVNTSAELANSLSSSQQLNDGQAVFVTNLTEWQLKLQKTFEQGFGVETGFFLSRESNNQGQRNAVNASEILFAFDLPLGRGAGATAAAADKRSAELEYEASRLRLHNRVTSSIFKTTIAYWECQSAAERLKLIQRSEENFQNLTDLVDALVKGERLPVGELDQAKARQIAATARRKAAELLVIQARQTLGRAMGLQDVALLNAPLPSDPFPESRQSRDMTRDELIQLASGVLERRADYQAALLETRAAVLLQEAARVNRRPRVDFRLEMALTGVNRGSQVENLYTPFLENQTGWRVQGVMEMDWPFANHDYKGQYLQRAALVEQRKILADDLEQEILSQIEIDFATLQNSLSTLQDAEQASDHYAKALSHEKQKFEIGKTTFTDLTRFEENLTDSLLDEVSARLVWASAVAAIRFETGTLLPLETAVEAAQQKITYDDLTTLPIHLQSAP